MQNHTGLRFMAQQSVLWNLKTRIYRALLQVSRNELSPTSRHQVGQPSKSFDF